MNKRFIFLTCIMFCSSVLHAQDADGYFELPRNYGFQDERTGSKNASPTVNVIPKVPTQDLIAKYLATPTLIVSDILSAYSQKIFLKAPTKLVGVMDNKVTVQGTNGYETATFIAGKGIRLGERGQFYTDSDVSGYGRTPLFFVFTTPDKHFFIVKRDVISLAKPKDIDQFALNRKFYIACFNSGYLYNPDYSRLLLDPFTRADLAYFVFKLQKNASKKWVTSKYQDVPDSSWFSRAVAYATTEQIMSEFPDGLFHPEKQVTRLEYVMTILRALKVSYDDSNSDLPYRDVKLGHWSSKFLRTALREGLIKPDTQFNGDSGLKLADFMSLIQVIPSVEQPITSLDAVEKVQAVSTGNIEQFLYPILSSMDSLKSDAMSAQTLPVNKVQFDSPKSFEVTLNASVIFSGTVLPPKTFLIGDNHVIPSADGRFMFVASLNVGQTSLVSVIQDTKYSFKIIRLDGYQDLQGHWSELTAAKLKALGILESEPEFLPNKTVTREDFVIWMSRALHWPLEPVELPRKPADLDESHPQYLVFLKAIQMGVLSVDDNNRFRPGALMTKAEAVTALMQAVPLQLFPKVYSGKFPFVDIPSGHWARVSVEQALRAGLILPSNRFYPRRDLTRAEFISLLSRMPSVQQQIESAFPTQGN